MFVFMEGKKNMRTQNLTLRDIHVGDWVQVWYEIEEKYSSPLKIIQICDNGTIYLVASDEERTTPLEVKANIKDVDALPITPEVLNDFGFTITEIENHENRYDLFYNDDYICELRKYSCGYELKMAWRCFEYFHDFIDSVCDDFPELLKLELKSE